MLQHGDAEHDVERAVVQPLDGLGQRALDRRDAPVGLKVWSERNVDESGMRDLVEHAADEARVVPAADVAQPLAGEAVDVLTKSAGREPDAEAVDRARRTVLTV